MSPNAVSFRGYWALELRDVYPFMNVQRANCDHWNHGHAGRGSNTMRILHICSDYPFTSVYQQLLMHFKPQTGQTHMMYVPLSRTQDFSSKYSYCSSTVQLFYSRDYGSLDRLLYHPKRLRTQQSIERQIPLGDISVVHAHYLFSAGGVAHSIGKLYGLPYLVAVRSSDINFFMKYAFPLRRFGVEIMRDANKIIFISPAAREIMIGQYVPDCLKDMIYSKSEVIPNGVDDFWLQNICSRPSRLHTGKSISLLYVGEVSKNKNVETSIKVTDTLNARGYNASLDVVGDGLDMKRIAAMAHKRPETIRIHGRITSKEKLIRLYRSADIFIMPSITETFGLVYLEAMSQGLPIIYTRYQGIDGYFEDGSVGYGCTPRDPNMIADRVERVIEDYDNISARCIRAVHDFAWDSIANRYEEIYCSLTGYGVDSG